MKRFQVLFGLLAALAPGFCGQAAEPKAHASPAHADVHFRPQLQDAEPAATPAIDVESLSAGAVKKALEQLQAGYVTQLSPEQIAQATLQGLLDRLAPSVILSGSNELARPAAPFYGEVYESHTGYLRPGVLSAANLDKAAAVLKDWSSQGLSAVVLDLRGTPPSPDFAAAARLAGLFCAKNAPLFKMAASNAAAGGSTSFTAADEPVFKGLLIVLVDGDTAENTEAAAAALRCSAKALLVGAPTAGRAFLFTDVPLENGLTLHFASSRVELPTGAMPKALQPDVTTELGPSRKSEIMRDITARGVAWVVTEHGRLHLNEAALVAGSDPDIDALEAEQQAARNSSATVLPIDHQLQRALDLVTSISVFQTQKAAAADDGGAASAAQ